VEEETDLLKYSVTVGGQKCNISVVAKVGVLRKIPCLLNYKVCKMKKRNEILFTSIPNFAEGDLL
jgi:hypothetical protein